jgi:uncharacterized membrane protein
LSEVEEGIMDINRLDRKMLPCKGTTIYILAAIYAAEIDFIFFAFVMATFFSIQFFRKEHSQSL